MVCVEFPQGLGHLVAPNEFGKSTLVEGLAAVVFGLPGTSDPAAFGQARFRHWGGAGHFEGEVEFTAVDGQRYRVWRDFAEHRVRLERLGTRREVLFDSTHNPRARRRSVSYEEHLQALIGIASRELFVHTFCVRQPLPEMPKLPEELQALLSGVGGGTVRGALEALMVRLRAVTKRKGDLGVASSNDYANRELEQLEDQIRALERAVQEGREAAGELVQLQRRLAEVGAERERARKERERLELAARAWQEWRRLAQQYAAHAGRRSELRKYLEQARELERRVQEAQERLSREYPEMEGAEERAGAVLDELVQVEERLQGARAEHEDRLQQLRRAQGRAAIACWRQYGALRARLAQLEDRLGGYELLERADPETLVLLRDAERQRAQLARELEQAQADLDRARERRESLDRQEAELYHAFAEVASVAPQVAAAIEEKLALSAQQEEVARVAEGLARRRRWAASLAAVLWVAVAIVAWAVAGALGAGAPAQAVVAVVTGIVAVAALWSAMAGGSAGALERARLGQLSADLARVNEHLGEWARAPAAKLGELRAQIRQFEAQREQIRRRRQEAPSEEVLRELEARVCSAAEKQERFESRVRLYEQRLGDVARAIQEWEQLRRERTAVRQALERLSGEVWGAAPEAVERLAPERAGGVWAELVRVVGGGTSVAELVGNLERWDPAFWGDVEAERALWPSEPADDLDRVAWLEGVAHDALAEARTLAGQVEQAQGAIGALEAQVGKLGSRVQRILTACAGDARKARERWRARAAHVHELEKDRQALHALLSARGAASVEDLSRLADQAGDAAVATLRELDELARRYPGLPGSDLVDDIGAAARKIEEIQQQAVTVQERARELEEEYRRALERQAELSARQPVNVAAGEVELAELRRRRDELWLEARALATAYRELQAAMTEFQASYRERLQESASRYYRAFTGRDGRRVEIDDRFEVAVVEPDGLRVVPAQLSKGAQDQLYLSLRLAVADLMASDVRLPFIFDDALLNCDDERLARIRSTLNAIAADGRQALLFSHRADFAAWGTAVACSTAPDASEQRR
jgi:DNA repair exonuclease SbcCD ATPase subunit